MDALIAILVGWGRGLACPLAGWIICRVINMHYYNAYITADAYLYVKIKRDLHI